MGRTGVLLLAIVVALAPFNVRSAFACTCTELPSVCEAYNEADVVFAGLALEVRVVSLPIGNGPDTYEQKLVRFNAEEAFRGVEGGEVDVYTGVNEAMCGNNFVAGERYLVYCYRDADTGHVSTNICTRTAPVAAADEDLEFLRSLSDADTTGRVYGVVNVYTGGEKNGQFVGPMEGMTVVLIGGADERFTATTDETGRYAHNAVPAGAYRVRTQLPSGAWTLSKDRVKVAAGGCSRLDVAARVRKSAI
jgi:hypothetical protein